MTNENMIHVGLYFPQGTVKRLDERRGRYYSRNRYFLKVVEEHLADQNQNQDNNELKNVQGPKVTTPPAQAPSPTSVPPTKTGLTHEADNLRHMTTDGGHVRRGGLDTNGK